MLVLSKYIAKHELAPLFRQITMGDVLVGARKVRDGLGQEIKSVVQVSGVRYFKVRIGRKDIGRMIVFLVTKNQKIVPVLIRLKKDKVFGMNMAMNNTDVVSAVEKNIKRVFEDIEQGACEKFEL